MLSARHVLIPVPFGWLVAGVVLTVPLTLISPDLAIVAIMVTAAVGRCVVGAAPGTRVAALRSLAVGVGLAIPTAVYLLAAIAHIAS
jgi:hypothetical protein